MPDNVAVEFVSTSILRIHEFSWVFLVDWLMIMLLSIFAMFYFNQLLGLLLTHTVGWYVWHRYDVYFKVEAVQISLFAGRIMFSNIVYIGTSEAVRIVHGSIGWRYWIRNRRRSAFVGGSSKGECALVLKIRGFEWFAYNREYAYEVLGKTEPPSAELAREFDEWQQSLSSVERQFSQLLPMQVDARNVAFVIGNEETESLVVVSAPSAKGVVDMDSASNESDRYSLRLNMQMEMPEVELCKNPDYEASSIDPGETSHKKERTTKTSKRPRWINRLKKSRTRGPQEPWMGLRRYMDDQTPDAPWPARRSETAKAPEKEAKVPDSPEGPESQSSPDSNNPFAKKWRSRSTSTPSSTNTRIFVDDNSSSTNREKGTGTALNPAEVRQRLAALPTEYAKVSQVLACDRLDMNVTVDVVGSVDRDDTKEEDEPLHSISLRLYESKVNYGPWTERQRQQFWSFFFPRQCVDARVPETPKRGELRLQKHFLIAVELLGESILVVPVREKSKDEQFATSFARNFGTFGDDIQRNYGWVELRVLEGSAISLVIPFLPTEDGFLTECKITFEKPEVRSSVTHDTMFYASKHSLSLGQRAPLVWNALQTWDISNTSENLDFYLLREHITLLADMINDFADGPPTPYALFVPIRYRVTWQLVNLALFLNVNKNNIINKPTSRSENTFIELRVPLLEVDWNLPNEEITAPTSASQCLIKAEQLDVQLNAPSWHTLQSFLDSPRMARVDNFEVQWSMFSSSLPQEHRFSDSDPEVNKARYIDTQIIDIKGSRLAITAYGFFVDYFMRVRENYFGHAYHFQTTEEFLQKHDSDQMQVFEFTRADLDMDAHLHVQVDEGVFLLPQYLYSAKDSMGLYFTHFAMDCRFTNYYMDLQVEFEPVVGRHLHDLEPDTLLEAALDTTSSSILSISQLEIRAHRMFGLPPSEPTYVVKWDFEIGDISLNADTTFLETKNGIIRSFAHGFSDDENKPILVPEELNDVTFLSANISSILINLRPTNVEDVSVEIEVGHIKVRSNDLANTRYSGRATIEIPLVQMRCLANGKLALEASTAIYITKFLKKHHAADHRAKQQAHIALHDTLFHRAPFLLEPLVKNSEPYTRNRQPDDLSPCIPLLPFTPPLIRETVDMFSPSGIGYSEKQASGESEYGSDIGGAESRLSTPGTSLHGTSHSSDTVGSLRNPGSRSESRLDTPEVYPFASTEATAERQRMRRQKTNFNLHATTWRQNAPTLPDDDDDCEHTSVIIQLTAVTVNVTPKIVALITALDVKPNVSFEAELDALQFNIVKALGKSEAPPEHVRIHLVLPILSLHLSERLHSVQGLLCEMKNIDIMWSSRQTQRGIHAEISSLSLAFRRGGATVTDLARINAASLVLSKVVLWWSELERRKGTGALNFAGVDVSAATEQVEWTISYAAELAAALASSSQKRKSPTQRPKTMSAMFYTLTIAGEQMGVEQDSYVLSRPSGAIQSRSHVRSQISWRIVMRLRYLLQHISTEELDKLQDDVAQGRFQLPKDARQRMLKVYRRWRSWEQSDNLEYSEIFKQVLQDQSFQEYVLSMSTRLALSIESMVMRLVYSDMREHYLGLDSFVAHLVSTRMNETQNLAITLRCSKMRAFGSIELVLVAAAIISAVTQAQNIFYKAMEAYDKAADETRQATPVPTEEEVTDHQNYPDEDAGQASEDGLALQASISMFLLDLVLEFDLETVKIETQNHQVQFTASVELMQTSIVESLFHTGVLATSNGAFRVFKPGSNQDILDSLITGIHVGYASRGPSDRSNTWATVRTESLSLAIYPTTPELAKLVVEFLDEELPVLRRAGEKLSEAKATRGDVPLEATEKRNSRSASIASLYSRSNEVGAGQFVNFSVASIKLRFALVDDLRLVLQGKRLELKLRHTDSLVGSFEMERGTLGIHYGENLASVAKIQIEGAKTVGRVDHQNMAIAMVNDVSALRMETMSLVWLLEYLSHRKLDAQVSEVVDAFNDAIALIRNVAPTHEEVPEAHRTNDTPSTNSETRSTASERSAKFRLRIISRIREISVVLPLDTSSFNLTLAEISAKLENFKAIDDLDENVDAIPQNISIEVADLALFLSLPHHVSREMLRLQFSVDSRQEDELDTYDVQSDYVRFALDPDAIGALFVALDKIDQHTRALFKNTKLPSGSQQQQQAPSPVTSTPLKPLIPAVSPDEGKRRFWLASLQRLRINILLKSLTITWYTGSSSQDGIILGFERLQIRVAELFARLELVGTYITPVVSQERQAKPVSERANTAYLPLVDAKLFITEKKDKDPCVHLSMTGKSVTLLITSSVAPWVLKLLDSWTETRRTVNALATKRAKLQSVKNTNEPPSSPSTLQKPSSFHLPFVLRMDMHFDRGVLRIFEEQARGGEPALELFSPEVGISAEYATNRLLLLVDVSPTSNKVYPKAISEIKAITSQLSTSLEQHQREHVDPSRSPSPPPLSSIAEPTQPPTMGDLELDVRIQLGSQDLYLSCRPFGKVGALFSTEQANLIVATPRPHEREDPYVNVQLFARGVRVSLQHIYSREISAMTEFSYLSILGMYRPQEPLKVAVSLRDPQLMIKLGKLYDIRTFFEIWKFYENSDKMDTPTPEPEPRQTRLRRKYSISSAKSPISASSPSRKEKDDAKVCLMDRYRRAVASVSIPWTANISITNFGAVVGMGPSIGDVKFTVTRIWAAVLRSSIAEQSLHAGIDMITAQFDGRLGGTLQMESLMAKAAILWNEGRDYPLIHAKLRLGKLGFYFSLDFHPFIAGQVVAMAVAITTQDRSVVEEDRIYLAASCESVSLVFTALVVSHTYDVVNLFKRLRSQISNAPIFMAPEVPKDGPTHKAKKHFKDWQRMINSHAEHLGIRTIFDIKVGNLMVHAFPTEFTDTVALKVFADRVSVQFDRKEGENEFYTSVDFALNECLVGLANIRGDGYARTLMDLDYEEFLRFVRRSASGGTIINTPEISMLMDTVEPKGKNEVRYTFSNHLFGSIEVGWNLGSVNFIKEMLETHKQAWAIRPTVNNATMRYDEEDNDSQLDESSSLLYADDARENNTGGTLKRSSSILTTATSATSASSDISDISAHEYEVPTEQVEMDEEVVMFGGTRYIATEAPVILIPQLRDLGDATPPIEWLGVNREKLPLFLHHLLTRKLELGAEELEKIYREVMGRLD